MENKLPNKQLTKEEILVKLNYISKEDLDEVLKSVPKNKVIEALISKKKITKDILGQALAEYYNQTYFDLNSASVNKEYFNKVSATDAKKLRFVIVKFDEKEIHATSDIVDNIEKIKSLLKSDFPKSTIKVFLSLSEDIDDSLKIYMGDLQKRLDEILASSDANFAALYFDELVKDAVESGASDIHLEPNIDNVSIRLRIDGILNESAIITHEYYENILNRIKVLASIRLDERYRAQDGAIRYQVNDTPIDLRVSIIPIMEGQKVVIRLLSDYIKNLALSDLGLNENNYSIVQTASKKTYGMILTTGPTGSGKTTTLYSLLKELNKPEVNITTIEDPVEYRIPRVNQIQVNIDNDITFAKGLRSVVRQDPNIILVGEIRDKETAEIAINAALTGHLLLSTFHANDAATAIPRLLDMGIEPFLLASTLNLIIAQRLVRRLCQSCKYSKEYTQSEFKELLPSNHNKYFKAFPVRLYKSKGCPKCNYTGFRGRIGIYEMIYITDEIQDLILKRSSSREIWEKAESQGAVKFFEDGLEKVELGEVSIEELIRVAPVDVKEDEIYGKKK